MDGLPFGSEKMVAEVHQNGAKAPGQGEAKALAEAQAAFDEWQTVTLFALWGLATVIGMIVSAHLGLYLVRMVMESGAPDQGLDILITGLVLGAGSKSVHDLITRMETAKNKEQKPPETRES